MTQRPPKVSYMAPRSSKASSPAPKRKVSSTSAATKAKPSTKKTSTLTLGGTASSAAAGKKPVKSLSDVRFKALVAREALLDWAWNVLPDRTVPPNPQRWKFEEQVRDPPFRQLGQSKGYEREEKTFSFRYAMSFLSICADVGDLRLAFFVPDHQADQLWVDLFAPESEVLSSFILKSNIS